MKNNEEIKQGLIGHPLGHSYSPFIHQALSGNSYELFDLTSDKLASFIKNTNYNLLNVTIPYKEKVLEYLDVVDPVALEIGAVNTIIKKNQQTYGYNTDVLGFEELLNYHKINLLNKHVLILGTGGTKKTVNYVASKYTKSIFFATRGCSDASLNLYNYEDLPLISSTIDYIINTTPIGMSPNINDSLLDLSIFNNLLGVIDVIYNPIHTKLLLDAKKMKIPYYNGLLMLVFQAKFASELLFEKKYSQKFVMEVYKELLFKTSSLLLIGMPASGKTTIGKILANHLNLSFVDLDEEVTLNYGRSPKMIIEEEGEGAFRIKETKVLSKYYCQKGLIIASGGGVVTIPTNYDLVKHHFIIVNLKRTPKEKNLDNERPLTSSIQKWNEVYEQRKNLYEDWADVTVESLANPLDTAYKVINEIKKK